MDTKAHAMSRKTQSSFSHKNTKRVQTRRIRKTEGRSKAILAEILHKNKLESDDAIGYKSMPTYCIYIWVKCICNHIHIFIYIKENNECFYFTRDLLVIESPLVREVGQTASKPTIAAFWETHWHMLVGFCFFFIIWGTEKKTNFSKWLATVDLNNSGRQFNFSAAALIRTSKIHQHWFVRVNDVMFQTVAAHAVQPLVKCLRHCVMATASTRVNEHQLWREVNRRVAATCWVLMIKWQW